MAIRPHSGALRRPRRVSGTAAAGGVTIFGLLLAAGLVAQEPDPAEAYGIYRSRDTAAADTRPAEPPVAAGDSAGPARESGPDPVEQAADDTSLTSRMDVRRGGGLRREEFPDLRQSATLSGRYRVFLELVDGGPWAGALTGDAPVTLLAPTDSAFAAAPPAVLDRLRSDSAARARWVGGLVLAGDRPIAELMEVGGNVRTAGGGAIRVTRGSDGVPRAGDARIIQPDMTARNGRLHGVDRVTTPGLGAEGTTSAAP